MCNTVMSLQKLTFFLFILTLDVFGQETKLITIKFAYSEQISERYSVLKSDGNTKHGEYTSYRKLPESDFEVVKKENMGIENYIKSKGNYSNGKKNGYWIEYTKGVKSQGNYTVGNKTGIWSTF